MFPFSLPALFGALRNFVGVVSPNVHATLTPNVLCAPRLTPTVMVAASLTTTVRVTARLDND